MITAVDTCVLIDIFSEDPEFSVISGEALQVCMQEGHLVVCDIVWSELAATFSSSKHFAQSMQTLGIEFNAMDVESATLAGEIWRRYRKKGGKRSRVLPDFLIAAHAQRQCDRLLTRDRGFYRDYFKKLRVLDPTDR